MISNIRPCCCRQCFNPNVNFYVEVINDCPDYINMILEYIVWGKTVLKPSPTFAPGKTERIIFPENSSSLTLRIYDSSFNPPEIICTRFILHHTIRRFKVTGPQYGELMCVSIN